jgi:hypothetical protein
MASSSRRCRGRRDVVFCRIPVRPHEPAADERPRVHSAATDPAEQSGTHDRAPQIWFRAARVDRRTLPTERAMGAEHREVERKYDIEPGATGRVPTPSLARHRSCVNETSSRVADIRRGHVQKWPRSAFKGKGDNSSCVASVPPRTWHIDTDATHEHLDKEVTHIMPLRARFSRAVAKRAGEHGAPLSRVRCAHSTHEIAEFSATSRVLRTFAFWASQNWVGAMPRRGSRGFRATRRRTPSPRPPPRIASRP